MIRQVVRLIKPGLFLPCFVVEPPTTDDILVRPRYLSICAADLRYFHGNRPPEVLAKVLPMALCHEAVGEVVRDPKGEIAPGTYCVLLTGGMESLDASNIYENGAFFRSSNADGFCQELLSMKREELLPIFGKPEWAYVLTEPLSVCCQAIRRIASLYPDRSGMRFGIWGDGPMAYLMALALKNLKQDAFVTVFGKHEEKLINFSFVDKCCNEMNINDNIKIDIALECVGGENVHEVIDSAFQKLTPCGILVLMGVSEGHILVKTRTILEKGITIIGINRSIKKDFETAINMIDSTEIKNSLRKIVSKFEYATNASDFTKIFSCRNEFKQVITVNL